MIVKQDTVNFDSLEIGQTFRKSDRVFMKVKFESELKCPRCLEEFPQLDPKIYMFVDIESGQIFTDLPETKVQIINCEVTEA